MSARRLSVVFVGEAMPGSRTPQRVRALRDLGHDVRFVSTSRPGQTFEDRPAVVDRVLYRLRRPRDAAGTNAALIAAAGRGCDLIWIENALALRAATLAEVKRLVPAAPLVWYCEDDMMNPRLGSVWIDRALPLFDLWVTTKSFNAAPEEMPARGVRRTLFVDNSYDPHIHRRMTLTAEDQRAFGADVAFIGTFERPRAASILALAQAGLAVRVWGNGWGGAPTHPNLRIEHQPVYDDDYARALNASRINLAFLRKANRDLQTCRTVEIPACSGFMLHEHSREAERMFAPDREAAFFGTDEEMVACCRRWLADESARRTVADAGYERVRSGHNTHADRMRTVFGALGIDHE
jgi:spore maturation protein CgeB